MSTNVKRPLSPHLSIYRPQITSVLSITHRLTGVFLYLGMLIFAWWIVCSAYHPDTTIWTKWFQAETYNGYARCVAYGLLGLFSFSLFYHLLNGIRHLFWDIGKGYEIPTVNKSGILVVIGSIALTALSWLIAFGQIQI